MASKCTAELSDRRSSYEVDANIQAVPPSQVFTVPRKNCWPAHISKRVPVIRAATSLASVGSIGNCSLQRLYIELSMSAKSTLAAAPAAALPEDCAYVSKIRRKECVGSSAARVRHRSTLTLR